MTTLATRGTNNGSGGTLAELGDLTPARGFSLDEVWYLAERIAASRLFAVTTPDQAFALMMLCQSDGLHPMQALRRYHIIEGRPAMRSDAMQALFQADGGVIRIVRCDAEEARATFSHPTLQPEPVEGFVTFAEFEKSGLIRGKEGVKANWMRARPDMLWARLVTKWIRRIHPGIVVGIYSTDEAEDMAVYEQQVTARGSSAVQASEARQAIAAAEVSVLGQTEAVDNRALHAVVKDGVREANRLILQAGSDRPEGAPLAVPLAEIDAHRYIANRATQLGLLTGNPPKSLKESIGALSAVYVQNRDWLRGELGQWLASQLQEAYAALEARVAAVEPDTRLIPTSARIVEDTTEGANGPGEG